VTENLDGKDKKMEQTQVTVTAQGEILFGFAGAERRFKPVMAAVAALEESQGGLWHMVEKIEANRLTLSGLCAAFAVLLPECTEEEIAAEIFAKGAVQMQLLLLQICAPLLTGLDSLGAKKQEGAPAGEGQPRCAGL